MRYNGRMSIYRYSAASAVSEVRFRYANQRAPVALLQAREGVDSEKLAEIRQMLGQQGWQAVPLNEGGKQLLQVTGFKDAGDVAAALSTYGFTAQAPLVVPEASDRLHKNINDWAEHHSLKTAGWLNLIGDVGLLLHGLHTQDPYDITAGVFYTGGAAVLSRYANVQTEHQVQQALVRTADAIREQTGKLPEEASLTRIAEDHQKGLIQKTEDFLYRFPAETMLSAYTLGALTMLAGGIKHQKKWDIAYGVSSVACKVGSLLIPEKHKADDPSVNAHADHGPIGQVMNWIQEKPLRVLGFGSIVTDTLLGISAYHDSKLPANKGKSYLFKFLTTGTYLAADLLMAVSNKHAENNVDGRFSPDEQARVEAMAAEAIAQEPKELRSALVLKVSRLLGHQPAMHGGVEGVSRNIGQQIAALEQNPWAARVKMEGDALSPSLR